MVVEHSYCYRAVAFIYRMILSSFSYRIIRQALRLGYAVACRAVRGSAIYALFVPTYRSVACLVRRFLVTTRFPGAIDAIALLWRRSLIARIVKAKV